MRNNISSTDKIKRKGKIIELRKQDYSVTEIADKLGMKYSTLYKFMKSHGISTQRTYLLNLSLNFSGDHLINNSTRNRTSERQQKILEFRKEGHSIAEIAKALNMKYPTVYKFMRSHGINTKGVYLQNLTIDNVLSLLKRKKSVYYIARTLGTSSKAVHTFIQANYRKIKELHGVDTAYLYL